VTHFARVPARRLAWAASLVLAGIAVATPAAASYFVVAKATASLGTGSCNDIDDSGVLTAPSASASALACPSTAAGAEVDIATASMGVFAFADSTPGFTNLASAEAEFFDVVHFDVPAVLEGQPFELGVVFAVEGVMTPDAAPHVNTLLTSRCVLGDLNSSDTYDGLLIDSTPVSGLRTIPGTITITPPAYSMNVSMHMLAPGLIEGTVDFLTTGELLLEIPPGVTYTSDSGVFHAPEPGAGAVGAAAGASLAVARSRRSRRG
jgi:hypothetical protein